MRPLSLRPLERLAFALAAAIAASVSPSLAARDGDPDSAPIDESGYVDIGGIEQWITIKGAHRDNPVVLFVHGGPGNPMSVYSDSIYGDWSKEFTIVHWDQRFAGKTYQRNEPIVEELTIERFNQVELTTELLVQDGIEVSEYALQRLGQDKLILTGSSWGSVIAARMALQRPELFHAYVGVSQLVNEERNMRASYEATLGLAREKGDADAVRTLEELGPPPWSNPRNFGKMRRILRRYEVESTSAYPDLKPGTEYDNDAYWAAYAAGEELSFLKFVGLDHDGMAAAIDLPSLGTEFSVPILLIQGEKDLLTVADVTRSYFDRITAPAKKFVVVPDAGHDPNLAMIDTQRNAIKTFVLPTIRP